MARRNKCVISLVLTSVFVIYICMYILEKQTHRASVSTDVPVPMLSDNKQLATRVTCQHDECCGSHDPANGGHGNRQPAPVVDTSGKTCTVSERRDYLRKMCEIHKYNKNDTTRYPKYYWRLLTDDSHKLLYCVVPKAAATSINTLLVSASHVKTPKNAFRVHDPNFMRPIGLKFLNDLSVPEIESRLLKYRRFTTVRHPFDRLYSAYRDKVIKNEYVARIESFVNSVDKYFNGTVNRLADGKLNMSFAQFADMVANKKLKDYHWNPYSTLCHHCEIQYDAILRVETLGTDIQTLYKMLDTNASLSHLNAYSPDSVSVADKLSTVSRVFRTQLDPDIVSKLLVLYRDDFRLFGYDWDDVEGATCGLSNVDDTKCC